MKFKHILEISGLRPYMKDVPTVQFILGSPFTIHALVSREFPDGYQPSGSADAYCECTTEGELNENKYSDYLRNSITSTVDGVWVNFRDIPHDDIQGVYQEIDRYMEPMHSSSRHIVRLLRWRTGLIQSTIEPIVTNKDFISVDESRWLCVSAARSLTLSFIPTPPQVVSTIAEQVVQLAEQGIDEPLGHQLYREAWQLRESNSRAALVIAVAAAEVGLKKVIGTLVPEAQWLLEEIQTPSFSKMLRKYIPTLKVRSRLTGKSVLPPSGLLNLLDEAVKARNKIVHAGAEPPNREEFGQMLDAICDFLWVCDMYAGQLKVVDFISTGTLSAWKNE